MRIITTILALCFLLMLGYLFFFKGKHEAERAILSEQRVMFFIEGFEDHVDLSVKDDGGPVIAIVIDGVGLLSSDAALNLPVQVTLGMPSYVPYEEYSKNQGIMKHNIALNIPVEPINYPEDDPDPQALLINNNEQDNLLRLTYILEQANKHHAVYSSHDDKYTSSQKEAENLIHSLKKKNIIYFSGLTNKNALIYQVAKKMHFFVLENDIILDSVISREEIISKLLELENIAKTSGAAIAVGGSYPLTIELLNEWIPTLQDKGIKILPIQDFYKIAAKRKALLTNK